MNFNLTVLAQSTDAEERWATALEKAIRDLIDVEISCGSKAQEIGQVVFLDGALKNLDETLDKIERGGRAVFLIVEENAKIPKSLLQGRVDDVLVFPFRPLEVLSKLKHYQQILMWDEVSRLNASFSDLITRLHDDLRLAERLQKSKLPTRFPEIKGFKVASRYLAGMKPGGDYFDLGESKDGGVLSMFLSDSSSYGLSSAVLGVLMKVAMKLSQDETRSSSETVRKIQDELMTTLGEKNKLSLFYATVTRKDYQLRFINLGSSCAYYAPPGEKYSELPSQGESITSRSGLIKAEEAQIALEPEGRLVLLSDGFIDSVGGKKEAKSLLNQFRDTDPNDALNEFTFKVKAGFVETDDLPEQDCTAVIFDVHSKIIRLAR